jgi:hypothetical protein
MGRTGSSWGKLAKNAYFNYLLSWNFPQIFLEKLLLRKVKKDGGCTLIDILYMY